MAENRPDPTPAPDRRKAVKRAVIAGIVLGLFCHALPPEHREICRAIAKICTVGIGP